MYGEMLIQENCAMDTLTIGTDVFAPPGAPAPVDLFPSAPRVRHYRARPRVIDVADLIDALAMRYPVVRRLAGDDSFFGAAKGFVFTVPPSSPSVADYGATFPRFLRSLGTSASIEYLADIAELEAAYHKAGHA